MSLILPGGTIGIIGGGQLARMMALEARRMGYRIAVLDPEPECPAAQVADIHVIGALDDVESAENLARQSDVISIDTEHVPASLLERLEATKPVRPSARVLRLVQDRFEQRHFLEALGAPQTRNAPVHDAESLRAAVRLVGFPAILKTRCWGYDGKGQVCVARPDDLADSWRDLGEVPAILESFVDFEKEVSVLLARDVQGNIRFFPIAENAHHRHILRTSRVPARISAELAAEAQELGRLIASTLGHTGVMAIELFVTKEGLLVNEIAPRTHNSGHFTLGACATSQFEQHVRAICGLPLGDPTLLRPAVMLNLLGDLWDGGVPPAWRTVFSHPSARLHLYGKQRASRGRKMGHVLVLGEDIDEVEALAGTIAGELEAGTVPGGRVSTTDTERVGLPSAFAK